VCKDLIAEQVDRLHFNSVNVEVAARAILAEVPRGRADVAAGRYFAARGTERL
jgi:hypothetical protein